MPFPSCPKSLFQSAGNEAIDKNRFHKKDFVLSLTLKVRVFGTREWPIRLNSKFAILTAI